eukprot:scaffold41311_cov59-Phaeocystis_antarctica.AAC.3
MGGAMGGGIGGGVGDGSIVFSARPRWASSESMLWVSAEPVLWPSSAASTNTLSMALVEPTCCRIAFLLLEHICNTAEGFHIPTDSCRGSYDCEYHRRGANWGGGIDTTG